MVYIDLDGVLADVEKRIYQIGGLKAIEDPSTFIRICAEHSDKIFRDSEVITENICLFKYKKDFRILSSLPHLNKFLRYNQEYYDTETISKKYSQLRENKFAWLEEKLHIHPSKLILVNDSNEKLLYCQSEQDILFDDYYKTINKWREKGGQAHLVEYKRKFLLQ